MKQKQMDKNNATKWHTLIRLLFFTQSNHTDLIEELGVKMELICTTPQEDPHLASIITWHVLLRFFQVCPSRHPSEQYDMATSRRERVNHARSIPR
jgi:hypothetical protein